MKRLFLNILIISFFAINAFGQTILSTRTGVVGFFSSAPLEDIKATNEKVRAVMNISTGEILIRMRIEDFQFRKSLMQRHFNDEYMESHLYPEAQLAGRILDWNEEKLSQNPVEVFVEGNMTMHGVTRAFRSNGTIRKSGDKLICEAVFPIRVADYDVKIPTFLIRNIAEIVEVNVKLELE
jgi:hypothetical protein